MSRFIIMFINTLKNSMKYINSLFVRRFFLAISHCVCVCVLCSKCCRRKVGADERGRREKWQAWAHTWQCVISIWMYCFSSPSQRRTHDIGRYYFSFRSLFLVDAHSLLCSCTISSLVSSWCVFDLRRMEIEGTNCKSQVTVVSVAHSAILILNRPWPFFFFFTTSARDAHAEHHR